MRAELARGAPPAPAKRSFPPIVDGRARILVLGTLPGEESLRRREEGVADFARETGGEEVVEAAWLGVRRKEVRSAVARLSPVQREALELAYFEGLTYRGRRQARHSARDRQDPPP